MYDCKINLDASFRVKNIKLFARIVYTEDVSKSEHYLTNYTNSMYGSTTTLHYKKGDYARTTKFHSHKLRYKKRERTYYKDYLKQF